MSQDNHLDDAIAALDMAIEAIAAEKYEAQQRGARAFRQGDLDGVQHQQQYLRWIEAVEADLLAIDGLCQERRSSGGSAGETDRLAPRRARDTVRILDYTLEVNHRRKAVLPASGLRDRQFQDLARYALSRGEFNHRRHSKWEERNGYLAPDPEDFTDNISWERSAYRHLEKALYRIAVKDGLIGPQR